MKKMISTTALTGTAAFAILASVGVTLFFHGAEPGTVNEGAVIAVQDSETNTYDGSVLTGTKRDLIGQGDSLDSGIIDFSMIKNSQTIQLVSAGSVWAGTFEVTAEPEEEPVTWVESYGDDSDVSGGDQEDDLDWEDDGDESVSFDADTEYTDEEESEPEKPAEVTAEPETEPAPEPESQYTEPEEPAGGSYTGGTGTFYDLSEEDIYMLAAIVQLEAGAECYECQLAVANTVLNRLTYGYWGSSVEAVIRAPGQFSPAAGGSFDRVLSEGPGAAYIEVARSAAAGERVIPEYYMSFCLEGSGAAGTDYIQYGVVQFY